MRWIIFFLFLNNTLYAKEWRSFRAYQKETQKEVLGFSDWLKSDRINNTTVWYQANIFNLQNNLPQEYKSIVQRRDFYKWLYELFDNRKHEVAWVKMAHFISKKMHLMEVFPYSIFIKKNIKDYAKKGSELVFDNAFKELKTLFNSDVILTSSEAKAWDKTILYKEQYQWLDGIYKEMDYKSLKTLERIAKRKSIYSWIVPKAIGFEGNLSNPEARYTYAVEVLKPYCENAYK